MTNQKNTRSALITSVLSMMLCVIMLIGSTFAWFTDNAQTGANTIEAGTLKVDLVDADGASLEGKSLTFKKAGENMLWEPGSTWALQDIYVKNNGNLALKYKITITGINGDAKLNEVIDWTVKMGDTTVALEESSNQEFHLAAGEKSDLLSISGHMQETAGNEYQGLTLEGISISVQATQDTVEHDSFGNTYDAYAGYTIVSVESKDELKDVIADAEGATVVELSKGSYDITDIQMGGKDITFSGNKDTVIDFTGIQIGYLNNMLNANLTFDGVTVDFADKNDGYQGLKNVKNAVYKNCTISGTQFMYSDAEFINCTFESPSGYSVWTYGAQNVTFEGCTFNTGGRAILVYNEETVSNFVANVTVNNCTFNDSGSYTKDPKAAVETGSNADNTASSNKYNLTFNGCTVNGFEKNNSTSPLWGNKNFMDTDHLNVVIDGADVY